MTVTTVYYHSTLLHHRNVFTVLKQQYNPLSAIIYILLFCFNEKPERGILCSKLGQTNRKFLLNLTRNQRMNLGISKICLGACHVTSSCIISNNEQPVLYITYTSQEESRPAAIQWRMYRILRDHFVCRLLGSNLKVAHHEIVYLKGFTPGRLPTLPVHDQTGRAGSSHTHNPS